MSTTRHIKENEAGAAAAWRCRAPDYRRVDVADLLRRARRDERRGTPMRATHVLLLCESLRVTGGVERFVCQLGNELVGARPEGDARQRRRRRAPRSSIRSTRAFASPPARRRCPRRRARGSAGCWRCCARAGASAAPSAGSSTRRGADVVVLNGVVTACSLLALQEVGAGAASAATTTISTPARALWRRLRARFYPRVAAVVSLTEADAAELSRP